MTITPTRSAATVAGTSSAPAATTLPQKTLNQSDFLKLLTVQLAQQDPMKPMEDTAFIAQMAQFTSLQQTSEMSQQLAALGTSSALQTGASMLGRNVTLRTASGDVSGLVDSVDSSTNTVRLSVGGVLYPLTQLISVAPPPTLQPAA